MPHALMPWMVSGTGNAEPCPLCITLAGMVREMLSPYSPYSIHCFACPVREESVIGTPVCTCDRRVARARALLEAVGL